ncbi:hypothetical protein Tco_0959038 [Tanacetum coccineum]
MSFIQLGWVSRVDEMILAMEKSGFAGEKEKLIKDQLFLSTQTLFKLNTPLGILHVDDHNHHRDEIKLKLDFGYGFFKRKVRDQELSLHQYVKPSIGFMAVRHEEDIWTKVAKYSDEKSLVMVSASTSKWFYRRNENHVETSNLYRKSIEIVRF